jgi:hypothetical protein
VRTDRPDGPQYYGIRVAYSVLPGVYASGTGDVVFVVVDFGAALLSAAVAVAAFVMREMRDDRRAAAA